MAQHRGRPDPLHWRTSPSVLYLHSHRYRHGPAAEDRLEVSLTGDNTQQFRGVPDRYPCNTAF